MNRPIAARSERHPQTKQDRDAVLDELERVLASPHFCNSKRYPGLLRYVVENTLAGKSDLLKERTLGVEVFDRAPSYDTNSDTVVRYTAGEVRKRLQLYYSEYGRESKVQISLPAGSYIPEFLREQVQDERDQSNDTVGSSLKIAPDVNRLTVPDEIQANAKKPVSESLSGDSFPLNPQNDATGRLARKVPRLKPLTWIAVSALILVSAMAILNWRNQSTRAKTVVDDFWGPILGDKGTVLICAGGNVLAPNALLGVITAGKDIDYPYFSVTTVSSTTVLSSLIERGGASPQFDFAASTPLPELRKHPVILLNAYNNEWTLRLVQPLRFHFSPGPNEGDHSIVDRMQAQTRWARDPAVPYSNADDYALLARFRDSTTNNWVLVLAGVGRNGTEAATQFVSSPEYLQLLRNQLGREFLNRNIEAVLKVSVIDGKTGSPAIVAVHSW